VLTSGVVVSVVGFDDLPPFFFAVGRGTFGGDGGASLSSRSGGRQILLFMMFDTWGDMAIVCER